jgi:hypothetical protein
MHAAAPTAGEKLQILNRKERKVRRKGRREHLRFSLRAWRLFFAFFAVKVFLLL